MSFGNNPDAQTNSSAQANNTQRVLDEMNSNADDLSQLNPQFKVPDVNNLDTGMDVHAPKVEDLKANKKREIKQPLDRFAFPDLKEILKVRSAMVITGVDLVDGKPTKWKIENSWGEKPGFKGYFVMSDSWFDKFVYQAVINKKYLSDELKKTFEEGSKDPIQLLPWDPMGALANNY